jgi:DNA-binding winged helix-turn-helix (wHTH) protein/tetratricopeptide (TPR) repeat protein
MGGSRSGSGCTITCAVSVRPSENLTVAQGLADQAVATTDCKTVGCSSGEGQQLDHGNFAAQTVRNREPGTLRTRTGRGEIPFFSFGDWTARPAQRSLERNGERIVLEPKLMDVLTYLADSAGAVISVEQLLTDCWQGTFYGDNPVHKTIALLRKALGDDSKAPRYIATVRKRGYQVIAAVAFADERMRGPASRHTWTQGSPFRGLLPFGAQHAAVFFGRARATSELLAALCAQRRKDCAFVLVTGPSGSGKSSLVHAGVLPALLREAGSDGVHAVAAASCTARAQGLAPHEALAAAMTQWTVRGRPIFLETERQALAPALLEDMPGVLHRIAHALHSEAEASDGDVLLLVVETLEALVTAPAVTRLECSTFITALAQLAQSGHVLVMALCRNDFYPGLMEIPELLALKRDGALYDVALPTPGEIAQMIRLPALAAGLSFERDTTTERRLDDVLLETASGRPGALPLLQYTLQALYELAGPRGLLTFAAYRELGGLEGALARRAELTFAQLDANVAAAFVPVLQRLVVVASDGEEVAASIVRWRDLANRAQRRLVQHLVDAHLLVSLLENSEPCFTVAHEALLRHWPRVVDWVESHRTLLRSRSRIAEMAQRWLTEGRRQEHLLPRGLLLADARMLYQQATPPLSSGQRLFVRRCLRRAHMRTVQIVAMFSIMLVLAAFSLLNAVAAHRAETRAEARRADTLDLLDFMLGDLHERLDALGRLDLLDATTGRALAVIGHNWQADDPDTVLRQARALREIGEIRFTRGDLESARKAFDSANTNLRVLPTDDSRLPAVYAELGKLDFWRGQVAIRRGHLDEARLAWTSYLANAERRATLEPEAPDAWLELSYATNCLGTVAMRVGQLDESANHFKRSIALKQRVLSARPADRKTRLELADTMSWLALAEQRQGHLRSALETFEAEQQTVSAARGAGTPSNLWRYRHALADLHLAKAKTDLGLAPAAAAHYAAAIADFSEIVKEVPDNRTWQRDLAYAQLQQGWLGYGMHDRSLAVRSLSAAERGLQALLATDSKVADWHALLALVRNYQSMISLRQGESAKATALMAAAWHDMSAQDDTGTTVSGQVLRATLEITSGETAAAQGDRLAMARHWRNAIKQLQPHIANSHDPRVLDPYVRASLLLGRRTETDTYVQRLRHSGYRSPMFEPYLSTTQSRRTTP